MARLWTAGAETGDTQQINGAVYYTTASTTQKRTGSYSYAMANGAIAGLTGYFTHALPANEAEIYLRFAVYWEAQPVTLDHRVLTRHEPDRGE